MAAEYIAKLRQKFKQALPKIATVTRQLRVSDAYKCTVSMWVPNIPYSKNAPGIALTLRHGYGDSNEYFRLIFKTDDDLKIFMKELTEFVVEKLPQMKVAHDEAFGNWLEGQAKRQGYKEGLVKDNHKEYVS